MRSDSIGARELRQALVKSAEHLEINCRLLDSLNVFPVPDGDTGTNMTATYLAGVNLLKQERTDSIRDISRNMNQALLKSSQGNSGFILARFFHGFFETAQDYDQLTGKQWSEGFANGSFQVNRALFSPVEGTMITIIAAMTDVLQEYRTSPPVESLRRAVAAARETLFKTPEMLPVLAKAGVVDSGALGFIIIMDGLLRGFLNEPVEMETEEQYRFTPRTVSDEEGEKISFRFCTEVILSDVAGEEGTAFRNYLHTMGDSIALVFEDGLMKLHIHTNNPEELISRLSGMGTVVKTKVEDMLEQMRLITTDSADEEEDCAVLACIPGEGYRELFHDLGVGHCLLYTKELPSSGMLLEEVELINAPNVIILPNNKNILPAAMLARDRAEKGVSILPTENIIQGLTSAYGFSENDTISENAGNMIECMEMAVGLFVHRAVSDSVFNNTEIRKNDYFIIRDDDIFSIHQDLKTVVLTALDRIEMEERGNISLYYNDRTDRETLTALETEIQTRFPQLETVSFRGGQYRETLIISIE